LEKEILKVTLGAKEYAADGKTLVTSPLLSGQNKTVLAVTPFLGLFAATSNDAALPDDGANSTEVNWAGGNKYVRIAIEFGAVSQDAAGTSVTNSKSLKFPSYTGQSNSSTLVITHIGIFDAATGGNMLYHTPLTVAKTLSLSDVLNFNEKSITVTLD
jgi:hypothetical protein